MASESLPRLRRSEEIRRVFRRGRCLGDGLLGLHLLASEAGETRVAIVVARRLAGSAVRRNRLRRRLREILRRSLDPAAPPHDLVVVARPHAGQANFWDLRDSLSGHLAKVGLGRADAAAVFPEPRPRKAADGQ